MAATDDDNFDLSNRMDCHEHTEDGWCYWLKPVWQTPDGGQDGLRSHQTGIWDLVPWDYELAAMQTKLDGLASDSPLRTPAFHLLWYAKELEMDREPITSDKL